MNLNSTSKTESAILCHPSCFCIYILHRLSMAFLAIFKPLCRTQVNENFRAVRPYHRADIEAMIGFRVSWFYDRLLGQGVYMAYTELSRHVGSSRQLVTSARHVSSSRQLVTSARHVGLSRSAVQYLFTHINVMSVCTLSRLRIGYLVSKSVCIGKVYISITSLS